MKGKLIERMPPFIRWLSIAALADWLVTRTLVRSAIFMPKSPPLLLVYQTLILGGQLASVLSALLSLLGMLWLAWLFRRELKGLISLILLSLTAISLVSVVIPPGSQVQFITQVLSLAAILWIGLCAWQRASGPTQKAVVLLPGLALLTGRLYQVSQVAHVALGLSGPPANALSLFNLGELLVVLCPIGMWWVFRRLGREGLSLYLWAAIPALIFMAGYILNPSMTGILAIWSSGLTLYLPWPVYSLSLWFFGFIILAAWKQGNTAGVALLLLAAGGHAPQLSTQLFFGLVGLGLLARQPVSEPVNCPAQGLPDSPYAVRVG